ncbi:MAG: sortase, partial [Chloroflexi bacterium]|nr:sortase [Chloroflexota bacterium]
GEVTNIADATGTDPSGAPVVSPTDTETVTNIFDPPMAWKVVNSEGWPELVWRQVWINNGNQIANNVRVVDPIPDDTTYVNFSLICEVTGSSAEITCEYDDIENQIIWEGSIGPDFGATSEAEAQNEIIITFRTVVADDIYRVENQSLGYWDEDGDGEIDENDTNWRENDPVPSDDPGTIPLEDPTVAIHIPESSPISTLPVTGFAPGMVTNLSRSTNNTDYFALQSQALELIIPSLNLHTNIVGVTLKDDGEWDTTWLWRQAGYLSGTAFPTWPGNTALTGHSFLPNGQPGPFYNLSSLNWGNQVILHSGDLYYRYEVRERYYVSPRNLSPIAHEENDWVTLISCYQYDEDIKDYRWRVIVRAILVEVSDTQNQR